MPAKIRTIKAVTYFDANYSSFFEFNKSINYKGETLSQLKLREKNPGVFKVKVFQDLNGDGVMTKSDLIFEGKIKNVEDTDDLTNFLGTIKLKKQMHSCEWDLQKHFKNKKPEDPEFIACTMDYVPTVYEFMLKSDLTGKKYFFNGVGDYKPEGIYYLDEPIA